MKISVIGTGHLGLIHCNLLKNNELAEFCGIYDVDNKRALDVSNELNTKAFTDINELAANSEAVIIASPTTTHYEITAKCLEADLHCFVEKPVTCTLAEAESLQNLSNSKPELILQVGHIERFNPAITALRKYNLEPLFIEAHRLSQFRQRSTDISVIHDLMIHDIDLVLWLVASSVKSIDANGVSVITDTIDIANARISFANGAVANLISSRISATPMRKMRFFQKFGYFSVDFAKPDIDIFRLADTADIKNNLLPATMLGAVGELANGQKIVFEKPEVLATNAIADEQTAFIHSIINKKAPLVDLAAAKAALEVAEEIAYQIKK